MTGHEAHRLAAHAAMPEIAPLCEHGHKMVQKRSRYKTYYWYCCECQSDRSRIREAERAAERNGRPHHDIDRNTRWCPWCDGPMKFSEPTLANRHGKWWCNACNTPKCRNAITEKKRKAAEAKLSEPRKAKREYWRAVIRLGLPVYRRRWIGPEMPAIEEATTHGT
jgi:hypothetical protein